MTKVYLQPGEQLSLNGPDARVGATGTVADLSLLYRNDGDDGVGTVIKSGRWGHSGALRDRLTFVVRLEDQSGRLWYDDERGY